jgi:hypothetical protein
MVSPEFSPTLESTYAQAKMDLFECISPKEHLYVQSLVQNASETLVKYSKPHRLDTECKDIPFKGHIPLSQQPLLGGAYSSMDFTIIQNPETGHDSAVSIVLKDNQLNRPDLRLITDHQSTNSGHDKRFWLSYAGSNRNDGILQVDDIAQLLDGILATNGSFSAMLDPRKPQLGFNATMSAIQHQLLRQAKSVKETRHFASSKYDFAVGGDVFLPFEYNAQLSTSKIGKISEHAVNIRGLFNVDSYTVDSHRPAQLIQELHYGFRMRNQTNASDLSAHLSAMSKDIPQDQLEAYLQTEKTPTVLIHRAIKNIYDHHMTATR